MNIRRRCLQILLFVTLLGAPLCEADGRRQSYSPPIKEVEATVLAVRRYDVGTYLEVQRDDGPREWIKIGREEGLDIKIDQRVAYTPWSRPYEDSLLGWLRTGHDFRILPPPQGDHYVYQGVDRGGAMIFTDNPSTGMSLKQDSADDPPPKKMRGKEKGKSSKKQDQEEVIVVDQEELLRQKEMTEEFYRYREATAAERPVRRAKRAKPRQSIELP